DGSAAVRRLAIDPDGPQEQAIDAAPAAGGSAAADAAARRAGGRRAVHARAVAAAGSQLGHHAVAAARGGEAARAPAAGWTVPPGARNGLPEAGEGGLRGLWVRPLLVGAGGRRRGRALLLPSAAVLAPAQADRRGGHAAPGCDRGGESGDRHARAREAAR